MNKAASLIIIFIFAFSFTAESVVSLSESLDGDHHQAELESSNHGCSHIEENQCEEQENHCLQHCSGPHYAALIEPDIFESVVSERKTKVTWSHYNHYLAPSFDPALKPPLFS